MELVLVVFGLLASVLPIALTILAITHIVRHGADWWWIAIVLFFPVMGSIAYFVASGALAGGRSDGQLFREMGRRRTARRRIAEARMRLQHGAPPAVEADLAEDLASLGEHAAAAPHFASALARLPERLDLAHGLARSLMAQGRCAEALPLLEKVCAANPRFAYGDAMLRLAQCLGESGQGEREEATLRALAAQSSIPEAQVRLAALCARTGRRQEAVELATRVLRDAPAWPRYLRAANRRWVRLARQVAAGQAPAMPAAASLLRTRRVPAWAMVAIAVVVALLVLAVMWVVVPTLSFGRFSRAERAYTAVRVELAALDRPGAPVDVSPETLERYLRLREATAQPLAALVATQQELGSPAAAALWSGSIARAPTRAMEAHLAFMQAVQAALRELRLSPAEMRALGAFAEWRFLRRPGAEAFALEYPDWAALRSARRTLGAAHEMDGSAPAAWLTRACADAERVEGLLAAMPPPSTAELAALEPLRARLSALPTAGSEHLAYLLEGPIDDVLAEMPVGE